VSGSNRVAFPPTGIITINLSNELLLLKTSSPTNFQ
jgi:hypothetical protein